MTPSLAALEIADPPELWRALGFAVDDDSRIHVGGVELRLGAAGRGITAWALRDAPEIVFVPRTEPPAGTRSDTHPNGVLEIDHVVITTPAFDPAAAALEQAGLGFRRVREAAPGVRQGFRRLGPAIMEVVEAAGTPAPAFWGVTLTVADLDALAQQLGEQLQPIRTAVQPGRQIATVARSAGLSTRVAFMTPE
jgi:hypothetical protein